jgi:hypothetical protein
MNAIAAPDFLGMKMRQIAHRRNKRVKCKFIHIVQFTGRWVRIRN